MIVATAKPDDLPALLELEESGFDAPERWSIGSWASELSSPDRLVLISRDDDQVEAVACFGVLDDTAEVADLPVSKRALYNWQRRSKVFIKTL